MLLPGRAFANLQKKLEYGKSKYIDGSQRNGIVVRANIRFDKARLTIRTFLFVLISFLRMTAKITTPFPIKANKEIITYMIVYNVDSHWENFLRWRFISLKNFWNIFWIWIFNLNFYLKTFFTERSIKPFFLRYCSFVEASGTPLIYISEIHEHNLENY